MNKKYFISACLMVLLALLSSYQTAFAHEGVTAGNYELEIGWVNEPPIVGQPNAIVVNVSDTSTGTAQPVEAISGLTVTVTYGDQNKLLTLQPLGEDTSGQFVAPILPTVPGQYTISLGGKIGATDVNAQVEPEEVGAADTLQFPLFDIKPGVSTDWLAWLGVLLGMIGIGMGITALRKAR
ncbi:MAG: hypothetical protein ABI986_13410 [Chloroflexota bacterium]